MKKIKSGVHLSAVRRCVTPHFLENLAQEIRDAVLKEVKASMVVPPCKKFEPDISRENPLLCCKRCGNTMKLHEIMEDI